MVVFDSSIIFYLLNPSAKPPLDPLTQQPLVNPQARLEFLVKELVQRREKIVIPTPALAEILVKAGTGISEVHNRLRSSGVFRITPFDERAAVECAVMAQQAVRTGDKRGGVNAPWQKIKFDRQIIAIALVEKATVIYSDDEDLCTQATRAGLRAKGLADLPLPEENQPSLF